MIQPFRTVWIFRIIDCAAVSDMLREKWPRAVVSEMDSGPIGPSRIKVMIPHGADPSATQAIQLAILAHLRDNTDAVVTIPPGSVDTIILTDKEQA